MEILLTSGGWIWSDSGGGHCNSDSSSNNDISNSNSSSSSSSSSSNATTSEKVVVPFELIESSNANLDKTVNIAGLRITQVNNDNSSPILEFRFTSAKCKRLLALKIVSNSKIYELYGSTSVTSLEGSELESGDDLNDGFSYMCTQTASVFPLASVPNSALAKDGKETFKLDYDGTSSSTPSLTAFRIKFLSLKCSGSSDRHLQIFSLQMHYLSDKLASSPNPKGRLVSVVSNTSSPSAIINDPSTTSSSSNNNNSSRSNDNANNNDLNSNIRCSSQILPPGTPSSHSSSTLHSQPHSQDALVKAIMSQLEVILPVIIGPIDSRLRKIEEKIADVDGKFNRLQSQLNKLIREDS